MKYIKTLYINTESTGERNDLSSSYVEILPYFHHHAYNWSVYVLGKVFFLSERLQSSGILDGPYKVSIIFPTIEKFKESDSETNLERWEFICNNFLPPSKGIIISFYNQEKDVEDKTIDFHGAWYNWPYKDKWQWSLNEKQDYVVIQEVEEAIVGKYKNYVDNSLKHFRYYNLGEIYNRIIKELEVCGIKYKIINYKTSVEETFTLLSKCKMYLTYTGGAIYLAGGMNVPTYSFGDNPWASIEKTPINMPLGWEFTKKRFTDSLWGRLHVTPWKVFHYNKEMGVHQTSQKYITNIGKFETEEERNILMDILMKL